MNVQELYALLAPLTAGVSLTMGAVSLFTGLKNRELTDLLFGIMSISLFIFLVFPPAGFIISDLAPYPQLILIKRVFIFGYYAVMPWFIWSYTGSKRKFWPGLITVAVVIVYGMMSFTQVDQAKPVWAMAAVGVFGAIFVFGLGSAIAQGKRNDLVNATWLMLAMSVFGVLFVLTAMNQFGMDIMEKVFNVKLFFSIHLHSLFLVLIMGFRLVMKVQERFRLEAEILTANKRWQSFIQQAPLFIVELDLQGNISMMNSFAVNRLGYSDVHALVHKNWFDLFSVPDDNGNSKAEFTQRLVRKQVPELSSSLMSRQQVEISVRWVSFFTYDELNQPKSLVCVGSDATGEENANRLVQQLKRELEKESVLNTAHEVQELPSEIIGKSEAFRYVIQKARQVASTHAPVLLQGETGVGKELVADLIHTMGSRNARPLIKVNCGALPKELIEDELFGHEKGAFTSAIQARKGRFELADGGTIFLDEVGELPLEMQPKLLRILQSGEFERVGGQRTLKVDVRVIAATNRNLTMEVQQGHFRDDLFYRLNVFPITIPPLRKRKDDLPLLISYFISKISKQYSKKIDDISRADMQRLTEYAWPGNVRELKNVIERSVITSEGLTLKLDWFIAEVNPGEPHSTLEKIERDHILKVMGECHWKINGAEGAAERLDMHPNTLRSRMKKLGILRPVKDATDSV